MDDRAAVCWLHRRAGFGLGPNEIEAAVARGPMAEIDALLSATPTTDLWDDDVLILGEPDRKHAAIAIAAWLDLMATTTSPLIDRTAWIWHGHFVSALDKVKVARLMVEQIRLFRRLGLGSFPALLRAVTIDPAMLLYLDGADSTAAHPNENFGREVLELFTIGVGQYSEADVHAGAAALSGWKVRRGLGVSEFVPRRHDDTQRPYLGRNGVHDLDTVVDAIAMHRTLAPSLTAMMAGRVLGTADSTLLEALAEDFAASGFDIATLVRSTLLAGVGGASEPIVLDPVSWLAIASRVTQARVAPRAAMAGLRTAGQVPMLPPNVAGWPGGTAWFASSTVVARAQLGAAIAAAAPRDNPARAAADTADLDELAAALALSEQSFGAATSAALAAAEPGAQRLALALCSPEFVVA